MELIQYPLTHPYPKKPLFEILTIIFILIVLPASVFINIVVSGYELVPVLRPNIGPNDTVPEWWNKAHVPRLLRREPPPCEPKDFGRGDVIHLTPSLFGYKVLSAWRNPTARDSHDDTRIIYKGASFKDCYAYETRFDFSLIDYTQTVTSAVYCPETPANMYMETSVTFANEITKDFVGQYYGFGTDVFDFVQETSRNYRKAVFAVLDVISTDSLMIMGHQHLSSPILSLSTILNITTREFRSTSITYANGTLGVYCDSMGLASIYKDTVYNLATAVTNAR
ncbi:hypothetical protein FRC08_003305 [Ceratobasidium sp. 394]|nr:hypothetical protein FRC08_003305 [Ceratobasidium sp. 394]